jgi:hypothetical protein
VTWRIVLRSQDRTERIVEVRDVRALRAALAAARSDPEVAGWRYWRLTELPPVRPACPGCGTRYEPAQVRGRVCRCGLMHIAYECRGCHTNDTDPPYGEGCARIPFDLEGVNERYRRHRWRGSI